MRRLLIGAVSMLQLGGVMLLTPSLPAHADPPTERPHSGGLPLVHTREQFEFIAKAPIDVIWPLFGANAERAWAPGWDPVFVWPEKAVDQQGMVFKIAHGDKTAIWVSTVFDQAAKNRVQYVYVIPDIVATVITLELTPREKSTHVAVTYERTALADAANESVTRMAAHDKYSGPEWDQQISRHLEHP
jgi:hypothetical protein